MKDKKYKLDIFKLLKAVDRRDFKFYSNLTDEEKKGFAGIVAMRWLSVSSDADKELCQYYIGAANEANQHFWNADIIKHPELQYLTLSIVGMNKKTKHQWIKGPAKKKQNKIIQMLKEYYPTANSEELKMFFEINDSDDFIEIAKMLGYQDDQIKEIKKEIKRLK